MLGSLWKFVWRTVLILLIAIVVFLAMIFAKVHFKRQDTISVNKVSQVVTYNLGCHDQKVLIEGKNEDLPIVIFLQGGPGSPIPFNEGTRGIFSEFTDHNLLVTWD